MTRLMYLLSAVFATACTVGEVNIGGPGPDSGGTTDDRNICVDRKTPAAAYQHSSQPPGPRSGQGCVSVGCHLMGNLGSGAGAFTMAGTVYKDTNGGAPQPGVTVRLFPSTGNTDKSLAAVVTDDAGNFIIRTPLADPAYLTDVTACGTDAVALGIRPMQSPISNSDRNCNGGAACHAVPGTRAIFLAD